ncbi:MAG: YafY family transcriptional regulator [Betaproteobacteria bacterium]|nr:MAG: YafY family transcriptional regulator [Betaproteobacteria bacterium]
MDRLERFYRIDQLLQGGRSVSFARLLEALDVSRAQLKRDLAYMKDRFHAPIAYHRESNGYRFGAPGVGPRYELPGLWFSPAEIYALLTMQQLLENLQPGLLAPHVKPLLARLSAILASGEHSHEDVAKRVRVLHQAARELKHEHFALVAQATLNRRRLRIAHYNRMEDRATEREISPQRLVHYRDNWYVDAWCHLRNGLRSFSIDAIGKAELLADRVKDVARAELDEYMKSGYGIFSGKKVAWAKLKFSPLAARWVASQKWHSKQKGSFAADGSYRLELPYADDRELVMDILKHGPDVEVLAPPELRARVREQLKGALRRY